MTNLLNRLTHVYNTHKKVVYAVLPFPFLILAFLFVYQSPLYIVGQQSTEKKQPLFLYSYTDSIYQGKTEINILKNTTQCLRYRYVLKEGYKYKFAYAGYSPDEKDYFFDLSSYNYALIKIKATQGTRIQFVLSSFIDRYTKLDQSITYRLSQYILNVSPTFQEIEIPFQELYTPDWWYSENKKIESDFNDPDLSKVTGISFSNCININNDEVDVVDIEEIKFGVNLLPFYMTSLCLLALYYGVFGLVLFKKKRKTEIYFENQESGTNTYLNEEEENLFHFLTTNYFKQDLSIVDVQMSTGISERKISGMIKQKTSLNFKQFINKLRIAEAKRLLSETDLQISEIAFKVGYINPSHFNRVFKTFELCSPNDYRKKSTPS